MGQIRDAFSLIMQLNIKSLSIGCWTQSIDKEGIKNGSNIVDK